KRALFARFRNDETLPERWVQNGAALFFASETAELSDPFVAEALAQLSWIKQHRKIFFLPAWVDAVVRSRIDPAQESAVRRLAEDQGLERDIRMKLLVPFGHFQRTLAVRRKFDGAR
ncbi:MAG: hypothetical protein KDB53_12610, partial [Planctomycetes bacterium]|nr:hypothetical protein [Planctomycetota bacterium]